VQGTLCWLELLPVSAECNCDCMFAHATKYSGQITRHRTEDSMNRCRASFSWLKANHMQHINPSVYVILYLNAITILT